MSNYYVYKYSKALYDGNEPFVYISYSVTDTEVDIDGHDLYYKGSREDCYRILRMWRNPISAIDYELKGV